MHQKGQDTQSGQSIVLVAMAMLGVIIFVAIAVDLSSAYGGRRTAQNGADGAALAAARQLAYQINNDAFSDYAIHVELNDFAERNGVADSDLVLANAVNRHVEGVYLYEDGEPIPGAEIGGGLVPGDAWGVEATTYITTPSYFGGVLGFDGYPVQATAAVILEKACGAECLLPIAFHTLPFTLTQGSCYNIWNGAGKGNFGWLNWTNQGYGYKWGSCSPNSVIHDLEPDTCHSGLVAIGDWIAGTVGVNDDKNVRKSLAKHWINTGEEATVPVWDVSQGTGCGMGTKGLSYRVAGFARIKILSYQLPQGQGEVVYPAGFDPTQCVTVGEDPNNGFRISAQFIDWVGGEGGNCRAVGTLRAPRITK